MEQKLSRIAGKRRIVITKKKKSIHDLVDEISDYIKSARYPIKLSYIREFAISYLNSTNPKSPRSSFVLDGSREKLSNKQTTELWDKIESKYKKQRLLVEQADEIDQEYIEL